MAPRKNLARPRSEVRLSRALGTLSMSTEEKVLKMNYGQNYENHLQSMSRQVSARKPTMARSRIYSAQKAHVKASLIPPHLSFGQNQTRQAKQQLKTFASSTNFTSLDPYSLKDGLPAAFAEYAPPAHYERSSDNLLFLAKL